MSKGRAPTEEVQLPLPIAHPGELPFGVQQEKSDDATDHSSTEPDLVYGMRRADYNFAILMAATNLRAETLAAQDPNNGHTPLQESDLDP